MNSSMTIAAEQRRRMIPPFAQIIFTDTTNEGLHSMTTVAGCRDESMRAYARWELDYRTAAGIWVDTDPAGDIRAHDISTDPKAAQLLQTEEREAKTSAGRLQAALRNWRDSLTTMKAAMEAAPVRTCEDCGVTFTTLHGPELCTACWRARR